MQQTDLIKVSKLLEEAGSRGVKIHYDNELIVRYPKNQAPDPVFLNELRSNKNNLIRYFKHLGNRRQTNHVEELIHTDPDGVCYEITPSQKWWVVQDTSLSYVVGIAKFKISGNLDMVALRKTVAYLVRRHECLRSTFHNVGDEFKLKVEDPSSAIFDLDVSDFRHCHENRQALINNFFYFKDHVLDIEKGPLFASRLAHIEEQEFLLSFKFHHIIYDAWSVQVFYRDMVASYIAIALNQVPALPELKYQLKEYNAFINRFSKDYSEDHKKYWHATHTTLPVELLLPGQRRESIEPAKNVVETLSFQHDVLSFINYYAKKYSVSLFVVLQATLKSYIAKSTGQLDITVGTQVFGRERWPESIGEQIGMYAETYLVRSILERHDSFEDILLKVIQANSDMQEYRAYTLNARFQEGFPPEQHGFHSFWKITVQYEDMNGYITGISLPSLPAEKMLNITPFSGYTEGEEEESLVDRIKIEYFNLKERMDAMITYNTALYDEVEFKKFILEYASYLNQLASDFQYSKIANSNL